MKAESRMTGKKIICQLLSFVLGIALAVLMILTSIRFGFFKDSVFLSAMSDMRYYKELAEQLQGDLEQVVDVYHIPKQTVEGIIRADQVYFDGYTSLTCAMKGKSYTVDVSYLTQDLQERLDIYAREHGIEAEQAVSIASESIIHAMSEEYERMLDFPFANVYYQARQQYRGIAVWIGMVCGCIVIACSVLLFLLHTKRHHAMREIDHAVLAATLMAGALEGYVAYELWHMHILGEANAYAAMMRNYFIKAMEKGVWSLIAGATIWFVLIIVTIEMRKKRWKKDKR